MTQADQAQRLQAGAQILGIQLDVSQLNAFQRYYRAILEWSQRVNLTSVLGWEHVQIVHFLDSLTVLPELPPEIRTSGHILDVGSGAGLPGIPLKIALPGIELALLEATEKKCAFLRYLVTLLDLKGVRILPGRAEDLAHCSTFRETFDVVLARGLAAMPTLAELTLPFVQVGGQVIAQKKGDFAEEVEKAREAIVLLGGNLEKIRWVELKQFGEPRALVILRKTRTTPIPYPRRAGMPAKRPLGSKSSTHRPLPSREAHHNQ